jgi:phosphoribosylaminoimidazole carboxylase (NCAIR synthetase)
LEDRGRNYETRKGIEEPGDFAVELFVDKKNEIYVNETAPRVHNSGHHTIEEITVHNSICYGASF